MLDAVTGEVLFHEKVRDPAAGGKNFDELLDDIDRSKAQAEEVFEREVAAYDDRDRFWRRSSARRSSAPTTTTDRPRARSTSSDPGRWRPRQGSTASSAAQSKAK